MSGKTTNATANVSSAYSKELKDYGIKDKESGELITTVKVSFQFDELDPKNPEHVIEAKKEFDEQDTVKAVNAARKAAALAKAREAALKAIGIEKPAADSEEVVKQNLRRQFRNMNVPDALLEDMVNRTYQAAQDQAAKQAE